ncbi:sulfite exporter TauE/SafE family protein [Ciceribacter sp. L1K23]|uniref:sulfite exporter TauE/SafE family protein n=1 Tax=Ciceribacter sp. L1K23 TaxID=2820276 RepID=UPI001B8386CE|nr:sulfite exporter TauE/SafE family protein [Ciceribacter sp. L1K23]MBR0558216.1 sulfite exporter TauE/SafE family protein [Ciceribacter sp. L1K23]
MLPSFEFFLVAIPAVAVVGLSKGGLGGAFALVGVPLMALAVPPMQAAAIFLPILLVMDAVALWAWRQYNDRRTLFILLPGAILGIGLGWATSSYVSANAMRLVLGLITVAFVLRFVAETYVRHRGNEIAARSHNSVLATFWGTVCGYSSFVAHAGGPPFQIYVLPLKLDPRSYTGASVRFFALVNLIKVIPYFALGELDTENLTLSFFLLPVALVSTLAGAQLVKMMKPAIFYPFMYGMALIAGLKLLWDGIGL